MRRRHTALSRSTELACATPSVIAMRMARMLEAGTAPTAADRREMNRMVSEKVQAFTQSFVAVALSQQRAQFEWWTAATRSAYAAWLMPWSATMFVPGRSRRPQRSAVERLLRSQAQVLASGLAPLHRAATANARRLARRRTR